MGPNENQTSAVCEHQKATKHDLLLQKKGNIPHVLSLNCNKHKDITVFGTKIHTPSALSPS